MGAATATLVGMGASALTKGISAGVQARRAAERARNAQRALDNFENNRQAVINPYAGVEDVSELAQDLSAQITNPYADLAVATQAAEMQAEEADIALANTLDTLRATGASAGGATALAQAALRSKKGVAASIEQQEAQNEKLRAQGEANLQAAKISEQQRLQSIAISEGQRVQAAEAAGKQFEYQAQEARTNMDLDRASAAVSQAQAQEAQSRQAKAAAWGSAVSGLGGVAQAYMGAAADSDNFGKGWGNKNKKTNQQ